MPLTEGGCSFDSFCHICYYFGSLFGLCHLNSQNLQTLESNKK